jgi:hypothetical protein
MPPHCDTKDGPVIKVARQALDTGNVQIILPYVKKAREQEVEELFRRAISIIDKSGVSKEAKELAEEWFFENVVRLHRAGEGAPYTGLKPAGLSEGPVIPIAEKAIRDGSPEKLIKTLTGMLEKEIQKKFQHMTHLKDRANKSVDDAREYVEAMLGLQVWSHKLYQMIHSGPHEQTGEHKH